MNVETGELFNSEEAKKLMEEMIEAKEDASKIKPVPKRLEKEAKRELAGRKHTVVDLSKKIPLAKWANRERCFQNRPSPKRKRKIAQASKRRNRKK